MAAFFAGDTITSAVRGGILNCSKGRNAHFPDGLTGAAGRNVGAMHTINPPVDNVLWVKVSGKLTKEEYADLVSSWEQVIAKHGKLRLLFEMEPDFTGWEPTAAWDD